MTLRTSNVTRCKQQNVAAPQIAREKLKSGFITGGEETLQARQQGNIITNLKIGSSASTRIMLSCRHSELKVR